MAFLDNPIKQKVQRFKSRNKMKFFSGLKTLDHLMEIPSINSALENGIDRYTKLRKSSMCFNVLSSLTEISFKIAKFAASPVIPIIKNPGNILTIILV